MSCDLGDGNAFRAETNDLPSKFMLCDNRWHNITAMYDSEQIVLRIDSQPAINQHTRSYMSGQVHTRSPLYIGGIPGTNNKQWRVLIFFYKWIFLDTAPTGTLLSRDNFKGCIRNVVIGGGNVNTLKDWTDMDELHNVLLSECQV